MPLCKPHYVPSVILVLESEHFEIKERISQVSKQPKHVYYLTITSLPPRAIPSIQEGKTYCMPGSLVAFVA